MKTVHLHIGSYKTGTTSIQDIFFQNRHILQQMGYLYPGEKVNHHFSFFATQAPAKDWPRQFKSVNEKKLKSVTSQYISGLEQDFKRDFDHQIVSTEYLFIYEEKYVQNYVDYLNRFFDEIKVYVFIRKPADFFRSAEQQMIKARSYVNSPAGFRYDFKKKIEAWEKHCEVNVIKYERGKDSCKKLCDVLGIQYEKLSKPNQNNNKSLSLEQMLLLEKVQHNLYRNQENKFKSHLGVIQHINPPSATKPKLKPFITELINRSHAEELKWLKEKYGVDLLDRKTGNHTTSELPEFSEEKLSIRDVYQVENETSIEQYEALVLDALLKKVVEN